MVDRLSFILITALSLLPLNVAHTNGAHAVGLGHSGPSIDNQVKQSSNTSSAVAMALPSSCFAHGKHSGLMFAHILVMLIAWFIILPLGEIYILIAANFETGLMAILVRVDAERCQFSITLCRIYSIVISIVERSSNYFWNNLQ